MKISNGNKKMGGIPSFSLPSGITCSQEACATCYAHGCYAHKIERLRPNVHRTYLENYQECLNNLSTVEKELMEYFQDLNSPRYFRIHVSGDFYSADYFHMWLRIAEKNPATCFLAFTKQYDIVKERIHSLPANFRLVWSAWPGVNIPADVRATLPIAWMQDGTETRMPDNAVSCMGDCQACKAKCWALDGKDVIFKKH